MITRCKKRALSLAVSIALLSQYVHADVILGTSGKDIIYGTSSPDWIEGYGDDDYIEGRGGNDEIHGGDGHDTIYGHWGFDTIYGGAGNDWISGGQEDDYLHGGAGSDTASYAAAQSAVTVSLYSLGRYQTTGLDTGRDWLVSIENIRGSSYNDTLTGNSADNVLEGGGGYDALYGGAGNDTASYASAGLGVSVDLNITTEYQYTGNATGSDWLVSIENLSGSRYRDDLIGNSGNNVLIGRDGHDTLQGGGGDDTLLGGDGIDTAIYVDAASAVTVSLSNFDFQNTGTTTGFDRLSSIENLTGSGYDDTLTGNSQNNILIGGFGNDTLQGGRGDDTLDGRAGSDTASYADAWSAVSVNLNTTNYQYTGLSTGIDRLVSIENVTGSVYNDTLIGNSGNNVLDGGAGTDTADYSFANASVNVDLSTTELQDTGTASGSDRLISIENVVGSDYDDTLMGNSVDNVLDGGSGIDTADYGFANASVNVNLNIIAMQNTGASSGNDQLISIENLTGSSYDDTLIGDSGNNVLTGGAGNDILQGGQGDDRLIGGAGIDTASYADATSWVLVYLTGTTFNSQFGAGKDRLIGIENVTGSRYDDRLDGDSGDNVLNGGQGNDIIQGVQGNNTLIGGIGNDILHSGQGDDILLGGDDVDTAAYVGAASAVTVNLNTTDFQYTGANTGSDQLISIENVTGSRYDDTLIGNSGNNVLDGGAGKDTADYSYANGSVNVNLNITGFQYTGATSGSDRLIRIENVTGSNYDDNLIGNSGHNALFGGSGNDTLNGGRGNDVLFGGAGIDTATYANAGSGVTVRLDTNVYQNTGASTGYDVVFSIENLIGSNYDDTLSGSFGTNELDGGEGNDILNGRNGNDTLIALRGSNQLNGGRDNDVYIIDNHQAETNTITDSHGNDTIRYTQNEDAATLSATLRQSNNLVIQLNQNNSVIITDQYASNVAIENLQQVNGETRSLHSNFEQLVTAGQFTNFAIEGNYVLRQELSNSTTLNINDTLTNNYVMNNSGTINLGSNAQIDNSNGRVNNTQSGRVEFSGSTTLAGDVINNGIITVSANELLTMTGNLSGNGSFLGDTMLNGAQLNPGNSPGSLTFGNTTWDKVVLNLEIGLDRNGSLLFDRLNILEDLTLMSMFDLNISFVDGASINDMMGQTIDWLHLGGIVQDANQVAVNILDFVNLTTAGWDAFWTQGPNNSWAMSLRTQSVNSVPEPAPIFLIAISLFALIRLRRRVH